MLFALVIAALSLIRGAAAAVLGRHNGRLGETALESPNHPPPVPKPPKVLRFNENREFTIIQFTDLHYGDNIMSDVKTTLAQQKLLDLVKPDLIINTGDAVSGYLYNGQKNFFENYWRKFTQIYADRRTYYAYTFGNHDLQADLSAFGVHQLEKTNPYSLFDSFREIRDGSYSNYYLKVRSGQKGREEEVAALLWLFDTRSKGCLDDPASYGCLSEPLVDWYAAESRNLTDSAGERVQGLAFFHIPLREYLHLWNFGSVYGGKGEDISCPRRKIDVFKTFVETGNVKAMFCGHDHDNDFGGNYYGIELVYGRKTGYGSYGPTGSKGARVIKLTEYLDEAKGTVRFDYTSFIVEENGTVVPNGEKRRGGLRDFQKECNSD